MALDFAPLTLDDMEYYRSFTPFGETDANSKYSFAQGYMWQESYKTMAARTPYGMAFTACPPGGRQCFVAPLFKRLEDIEGITSLMLAHANSVGIPFEMDYVCSGVRQQMEQSFPNMFEFAPDRDNSEYVYLTSELISLSGKKLHQKRNHINAFLSANSYTFRPYDNADFAACMALQRTWAAEKGEEQSGETEAIEKLLTHYVQLNVRAGVIEQQGEITAFSIGEKISPTCAVILIEKASSAYNGLYQLINRCMAQLFSDTVYINRCEDMGIEGLRKAKLSYKPCMMVDKYVCRLKEQL